MQLAERGSAIVTNIYHNTIIEAGCYGIIQFTLHYKMEIFSLWNIKDSRMLSYILHRKGVVHVHYYTRH